MLLSTHAGIDVRRSIDKVVEMGRLMRENAGSDLRVPQAVLNPRWISLCFFDDLVQGWQAIEEVLAERFYWTPHPFQPKSRVLRRNRTVILLPCAFIASGHAGKASAEKTWGTI